jgi:DNA-binding CsgD family transcriptional regulator/tetratricopeptide (TPR) repeat protein
VGLVVSYRAEDLHRRHPLRPQIAEWARLRGVLRLHLEPLPPEAVRDLVGRLVRREHGQPLSPAEVSAIVERAEGNAFFAEELVGAADRLGRSLPEDLADLLLIRLDRLDGDARDLVRVAATAGRRVPHTMLAEVSGLDPARLDVALRQAVEQNVLRTDGDHLAFRHALLAEAAHDDLLPGERVRLHARFVEVLRHRPGAGTAAELAHHARHALDRTTALAASIEAAREAMSVGGPTDATRHYDIALELLADPARSASSEEDCGVDLPVVAAEAAEALVASGHVTRAVWLLGEQLERLRPGDPAGRARLLSARASALSMIETEEDPVAISAEAVRLLADDDSALRARVLAAHARVLDQYGRAEEARDQATAAFELAERLGLPQVASDAFTTMSRIGGRRAGGQGRAALTEAVERARRARNPTAELRGQFWLGLSHLGDLEWSRAEERLRTAMRLGVDAGIPWAPYAFESRWFLARVLALTGEWDEALVVLQDPDENRPAVPAAMLDVLRCDIEAARGADVGDRLARVRPLWTTEGLIAVHAAEVAIEMAGRARRPDDAVAAYDAVVDVMSRVGRPRFEAQVRLAGATLTVLAGLLERQPSAARARLVAEADRLVADIEAVLDPLEEIGAETAAWAALGRAERERVRWLVGDAGAEATGLVGLWRSAAEAFEHFGHVYRAARCRATLAEILTAVGDPDGARTAAGQAREVATRLGAVRLLERIDRGAGPGPWSGPAATTSQAPPGERLTPREREVLVLVAQGRSNGEIGRLLFISTKTVSVHVSNILAKLGASGRTEAAALARRQGLVDET